MNVRRITIRHRMNADGEMEGTELFVTGDDGRRYYSRVNAYIADTPQNRAAQAAAFERRQATQ